MKDSKWIKRDLQSKCQRARKGGHQKRAVGMTTGDTLNQPSSMRAGREGLGGEEG